MGVKVQYSDWSAIDLVQRSEGWKSNAMIATQREQFGLWIGRVGKSWTARAEFEEGRSHLVEGKGIVKGCDGDIATIKDGIR